jgi:16S rRNA (guanine966-N2)-methyltransferase
MRVIAGTAGGILLEVPKNDIRPTMDRVKAAIFSSLGDRIIGARVLDLFAGTGALGIEALSRGAAEAAFIDHDRSAVEVIERNLKKAGVSGRVQKRDVFDFLKRRSSGKKYDIILADPPYDRAKAGDPFTKLLLASSELAGMLDSDGIFVLEKMPAERLPPATLWNLIRNKTYGATEVLFLQTASLPAGAVERSVA